MNLVLASSSPRRRELLRLLGVPFAVRSADIDESRRPGEPAADLAQRLARSKAQAVSPQVGPAAVLAADTVVALGERVFGKPADRAEGLAALQALSGVTHSVYTAVVLQVGERQFQALSASRVTFRGIPTAEAQAYWDSGEPADKAGGYAIQGYGAAFVRAIEGSHSGIVGLPLVETLELLQAAGLATAYGIGKQEVASA